MRADGVLTTVDIEAEHQRLAKQTFAEAGIPAQRVRTISGAALDVLPRLTDGHYDLVFCDGDKAEYAAYLNEALRLLRPGGVVAFDNALWHDRVADPAQRDDETVAIRELGREIADEREPGPGAAARRRRAAGGQEGVGAGGRRGVASGLRARAGGEAVPALGDRDDRRTPRSAPARCRSSSSPGTSAAPAVNVSWNSAAGVVGREHVDSPRTTRRGGIRQVLKLQPVHAGEPRVRGVRDVRREVVLDALGGIGEGPADGEAVHVIPSRGSELPSQPSSARAPKPVGPWRPLVVVLGRVAHGGDVEVRPRHARRRSAGGTAPR